MTWTPTEAMRRTEKLMLELQDAAQACGVEIGTSLYPMYHARVFDLISKAIDEALATGGAVKDAADQLSSLTGNPESSGLWVPVGNGRAGNGHTTDFDSVHADGPYPGFDPVIEAREEGPGFVPAGHAVTGAVVNVTPGGDVDIVSLTTEPPKRKRGRPPGPSKKGKAKKVKAAKEKKSAKVLAETAEQRAPAMEALASGDNEAPAVEAAP